MKPFGFSYLEWSKWRKLLAGWGVEATTVPRGYRPQDDYGWGRGGVCARGLQQAALLLYGGGARDGAAWDSVVT